MARPAAAGPPKVSVIIPLHRDNPGFRACVAGCLALDYPSLEVIVVSDETIALPRDVKSVLTGAAHDTGPGEKRDAGMHAGAGDFFAFIDDDAVPLSDWLTNAVRIFDGTRRDSARQRLGRACRGGVLRVLAGQRSVPVSLPAG